MHEKRTQKNRIRAPTLRKSVRFRNTGYSEGGASRTSNILKAWNPERSSAKADIDANLRSLRGRSADQVINTPVGAAAINSSVVHAVGDGLRLFPRIPYKFLGLDAKAGREWARKTSREFDLWAASKNCDLYRRNNFYDLQFIAYSTYLTDGDSFSLFRRKNPTFDMPYSLRIQLLEANRVSNPINQGYISTAGTYAVEMKAPNGNRIVNGVEIAADGEIVAFWISNKVPNDPTDFRIAEWVRVEAFGKRTGVPNILQVCHDTRAEQYRGVPYLAPVLELSLIHI